MRLSASFVLIGTGLALGACPATAPCPTPTPCPACPPADPSPVTAGEWPAEAARFEVGSLTARIDEGPPQIEEYPTYVKLWAPAFRVWATVGCDVAAEDQWAVGLIQAVTDKKLQNDYPDATTIWTFPVLPINDSDGTYPWYSAGSRVLGCSGEAKLYFEDALFNSVSFDEPRPSHLPTDDPPIGQLTRYHRYQAFRVWLVAWHLPTDRIVVLKEIDWKITVDIDWDTSRPAGSRATAVHIDRPEPVVRDGSPARPIPLQARIPPRANDADEFWWRPKAPALGPPQRVIQPDWGPR